MSAQPKKKGPAKFLPEIQPNYIACLNCNFGWHHPRDLEELQRAWEMGLGYQEIAKVLKRPEIEVVIYIMDQWEKGNLPERPGGIYGRRRRG
ncbi:hypothetical protein EDC32_10834 [Laceyella sacchari]|uniref:hypothetical protein n=1 Tax=Laceyella sacchari TaxID=37482 RepID=UPI000AFE3718|nr:hypothetical protein [Laceyella sacchari]TCW35322.1 hypothetical protein EDC32_10834 [Laceyella sacchari]